MVGPLKIAPCPATTGRQHLLSVKDTVRIVHLTDIRHQPTRSLTPHSSSDQPRRAASVDSGLGWRDDLHVHSLQRIWQRLSIEMIIEQIYEHACEYVGTGQNFQ